ncbi:NAD(P)/FAD-dependent oxidoreductase [Streptomyces sp. NPDC029674]|uniref:NAD(P)/FAD-dependent oxidoreductase n=1 Tax=Streptomyces sp. NPDC029674 TaxID=3365297 RepID=UPI00384D9575
MRAQGRMPDRGGRAVVLGAGMAGMLAAGVLSGRVDEVVLVDRDRMPAGTAPRRGLPQARHAHLMMSGGAHVIEALLPGTVDAWVAAGARRVGVSDGIVVLGPGGWFPRRPDTKFLVSCTRDLLDAVVRARVLALPRVALRDGTEAVELLGDRRRVAGVAVRETGGGAVEELAADLVVDASGRGSQAPHHLARLGLPAIQEETVDAGQVYATRLFRAPPGTERFPMVSIQPDPRSGTPGRAATLLPVEGGRWLVTVAGTRGAEPTRRAADFEPFARTLRDPLIADLIARAEPLTDVHLTRSTVNRRRRFERLTAPPEGFLVLGDAVATFNPVYGQGLSVAAHSAAVLDRARRDRPVHAAGFARHVQREVARATAGPWGLATGEDLNYPGTSGKRPPPAARLLRGYTQRMMRAATGDPAVLRALTDLMTLSAPLTCLARPAVLLGVARGPGRHAQRHAPITPEELALCGLGGTRR